MKKQLLLLIVPALIYADDLKSLLDFATTNNNIVVSKEFTQKAKLKDIGVAKSAIYPTIDVGGYYKRDDDHSPFQPGDIYSGYVKVGVDLYNGGKSSNTIKEYKSLHDASKYASSAYKKSLQLQISEDFYNLKSVESRLDALKEAGVQLMAALQRVKKFYEVGSVTKDDVKRLEAAYSNNIYAINSAKYQKIALQKMLALKVGKKVEQLDNSTLIVPHNLQVALNDNILTLQSNATSLKYAAKSVNSRYYPQIRFEDTYSVFAYNRKDPKVVPLNEQNQLMLTLNIRLFDRGTISKQKESLLLQKEALGKEIEQYKEEQKSNIELALLKIETVKAQIASAKSSLDASTSAYETVQKKYAVGLVDYVTYLDALTVKTEAKSQYESAVNSLQIAYAKYYFYTNKNIKDFIQ